MNLNLNNIICKICEKQCKSLIGLSTHIRTIHNVNSKDYYDKYLKTDNDGFCLECGKQTTFYRLGYGYRKFCSLKCSNKNEGVQQSKNETTYLHYGVNHPLQSDEVKKIAENTSLMHYGVSHPKKSSIIKNKTKQTILDRYGVENVFQVESVKEKIKSTVKERYGSTWYTSSEIGKEQIKNTYIQKYGVSNPMLNINIRQKASQKYVYNEIKFDSSWELSLYIMLMDLNIPFKYQPNIKLPYYFNNKLCYYFPDFIVYGQLIELKSDYLFEQMQIKNTKSNAKYNCMLANNVKILLYADIKECLDYIDNKYGKKYLQKYKLQTKTKK